MKSILTRSAVLALFAMLVLTLVMAGQTEAAPAITPGSPVGVSAAIVYDLDDDVILFEQNADTKIPPASLTKILSMFLALDFIKEGHAEMDTPVDISAAAASTGGSLMGIRAKEKVALGKLLLGMAVSSGNDASHAVAEFVGGSHDNFVKMMNAKAAEIGMTNSHFANPHGLPARNHVTTARDMLTLARAYLKAHPNSLEMHNTTVLEHDGYRSWNKNPLLGQYAGADGLKSGWIRASGYNLVFTASRGSKRLLAVILGAPDSNTRAVEACRLLDAGFMVCDNSAVSVAAALDTITSASVHIDPLKIGREAGLLKKRSLNKRLLTGKLGKYGRMAFAPAKANPSLLRKPAHVSGASTGKKQAAKKSVKSVKTSKTAPKKNHHAARSAKKSQGKRG